MFPQKLFDTLIKNGSYTTEIINGFIYINVGNQKFKMVSAEFQLIEPNQTSKDIVISEYPEADVETNNRKTIWRVYSSDSCLALALGVGRTEEEAWHNAARNIRGRKRT